MISDTLVIYYEIISGFFKGIGYLLIGLFE